MTFRLDGFSVNQLVTTRARASGTRQRKVYRVVGESRALGKVRVASWSAAARRWSNPYTHPSDDLVPAPSDWTCTRSAARDLAD